MSRARTNANNWAADITEVQAGTGISVTNGTGPAPTVTNSMATTIDAKGDLLVGTGDNAFARLPVSANGDTLLADSSTSTGLRWQGNFAAGKNALMNGDFRIWQRGTSFTLAASTRTYTADRFNAIYVGSSQVTTVSQQIFTAGTAPVAGYEGQFFLRYAVTGTTTGNTANQVRQPIEDVRTFAGQTATFSFWAKADTNRALTVYFSQNFGSGGSSEVFTANQTVNITSTWARYSVNVTLPSISGKTIGAGNNVTVNIEMPTATTQTVDFWGWQLEAGNVATAFQTATGTLQGELAACQRYYFRFTGPEVYSTYAHGYYVGSSQGQIDLPHPVPLRVKATSIDFGNVAVQNAAATISAINSLTIDQGSTKETNLSFTIGSGGTLGQSCRFLNNNNANGFIGLSAEL